jgi:hypothetical protein
MAPEPETLAPAFRLPVDSFVSQLRHSDWAVPPPPCTAVSSDEKFDQVKMLAAHILCVALDFSSSTQCIACACHRSALASTIAPVRVVCRA